MAFVLLGAGLGQLYGRWGAGHLSAYATSALLVPGGIMVGAAAVLKQGSYGDGLPVQTWGDLHHPQMSLTNGKYDGEWIAVSDKAAGRVGIISMKDLKTKTIFKTPNTVSDHHAVFTENSEYLVQSAYFPMPFNEKGGYAPIAR